MAVRINGRPVSPSVPNEVRAVSEGVFAVELTIHWRVHDRGHDRGIERIKHERSRSTGRTSTESETPNSSSRPRPVS